MIKITFDSEVGEIKLTIENANVSDVSAIIYEAVCKILMLELGYNLNEMTSKDLDELCETRFKGAMNFISDYDKYADKDKIDALFENKLETGDISIVPKDISDLDEMGYYDAKETGKLLEDLFTKDSDIEDTIDELWNKDNGEEILGALAFSLLEAITTSKDTTDEEKEEAERFKVMLRDLDMGCAFDDDDINEMADIINKQKKITDDDDDEDGFDIEF